MGKAPVAPVSAPSEPHILDVNPGGIPESLRALNEWLVWEPTTVTKDRPGRDGRPKFGKVPITPRAPYRRFRADHPTPGDTGTFEEALAYARQGPSRRGVSLAFPRAWTFGEHGLVVIDLDGVRDPQTGRLDDWAADLVQELDSYTERSVSGRGVHVFLDSQLEGGRWTDHSKGIEVYGPGARLPHITLTGQLVEGAPVGVKVMPPECLERILEPYRPAGSHREGPAVDGLPGRPPAHADDVPPVDELPLSSEFQAFLRDTDDFPEKYPSRSEALFAVCMALLGSGLEPAAAYQVLLQNATWAYALGKRQQSTQRAEALLWSEIRKAAARVRSPVASADEFPELPTGVEPEQQPRKREVQAFDLNQARVTEWLERDPPPREWLVQDRLPLHTVAILAAAGKTGKSMAALQLAFSVCTGWPWLGLDMGRTGPALILSTEDTRRDMWERFRAVLAARALEELFPGTDPTPMQEARKLLAERLYVVDLVGHDNRLTEIKRGALRPTDMHKRIIKTVEEIPGCRLVVLDPLIRFDGGTANDNAHGTRLIEIAERIRIDTGATVLIPHHINKAGMNAEDAGQEVLLGASALGFGARWQGLLRGMRPADAKKYGLTESEAKRRVRFEILNANHAAPWDGVWLSRGAGGVLTPCELQPIARRNQERQDEDRYRLVLPRLIALVRERQERGEPLTRSRLRDHAGSDGRFGVSDRTLRRHLDRAIDEGQIKEKPAAGHRGNELWTC